MTIFRLRVQTDYIQTTNVREPYYLARILARYDAEQLLLIEGLKGLAGKNGRADGVCRPAFHHAPYSKASSRMRRKPGLTGLLNRMHGGKLPGKQDG
jgi:hypothetical protein